ncbi:MAG: hypothetical protein HOY79_20630 [Streptomyces sp.]|nr:hypothetical protein [Streptomyces sp.]
MTTPAVLEVFAPITKRERDPETGHLYVYGKITGSDLDRDQQRMDSTWLKTAVPDWFKVGNLREQHDPRKAVGKAVHLEEKTDGWYIGAKVVDREAAEKVEEGVLTGFSIGVKNYRLDMSNKSETPNGTVVDGRICETSLVDSPCLGSATIADHYRLPLAKADAGGELQPVADPLVENSAETNKVDDTFGLPPEMYDRLPDLVKTAMADLAAAGATVFAEAPQPEPADTDVPVVVNVVVKANDSDLAKYTAAEERQALSAGQAMPNAKGEPSYVIKTKADLRKAIRAVGRGNKSHDSIRAHIVKRAAALGLEAMVPDNWNTDGSLKTAQKAQALLEDLRSMLPDLSKADDDADGGGDESEPGDISGAKEAIAIIARLVQSEAEGLASGDMGEACDISMLLDAVRALKWFIASEAAEGTTRDADTMMLADGADLEKAAKNDGKLAPPFKKKNADDADSEDDAEDGDGAEDDGEGDDGDGKAKKKTAAKSDTGDLLTKADAEAAIRDAVARALAGDKTSADDEPQNITKAELEDMVKTLVAEARTADQERIEALSAQVAKQDGELAVIKATPIPGGPVLTRTTAISGQARDADAEGLRGQAAELLAKAEQFSGNRDLADGYRQRAKRLLEMAAA